MFVAALGGVSKRRGIAVPMGDDAGRGSGGGGVGSVVVGSIWCGIVGVGGALGGEEGGFRVVPREERRLLLLLAVAAMTQGCREGHT